MLEEGWSSGKQFLFNQLEAPILFVFLIDSDVDGFFAEIGFQGLPVSVC